MFLITSADLEKILKVEIAENGEYLVNGGPMDRLALLTTLKRYARLMPDAEFLVRCHPESKHKDLVTFLADASLLELKNIKNLSSEMGKYTTHYLSTKTIKIR